MADIRYAVVIDAARAQANLDNLQKKAQATTSVFQKLTQVLGGLAIGATIGSVMNMANRLTDLSAATGVAVQELIGFTQAVAANGGSVEIGEKAIVKFGQAVGNAASGTKKTAESFKELGISLKDLKTLGQEELLAKTVQGLSKIENASVRAAKATELFGKSAATIDFVGVNNGLAQSVERAGRYADAVTSAGNANQGLADSFRILQLEVAVIIKPLSDLIVAVTANKELVTDLAQGLVRLVAAFVGFAVVARVAAAFSTLAVAIGAGSTAIGLFIAGVARFAGPIGIAISALTVLNTAIKAAFNVDLLGDFTRFVGENIVAAFNKVRDAVKEIKFIYDDIVGNDNIRNMSLFDLQNVDDTNAALEEVNRRLAVNGEEIERVNGKFAMFMRGIDDKFRAVFGADIFSNFDKKTNQYRDSLDQLQIELEKTKEIIEQLDADRRIELINNEALQKTLSIFSEWLDKAKEYTKIDYTSPLDKADLRVVEITNTIAALEAAYRATNGQIENFDELMTASKRALQEANAELLKLQKVGGFGEYFDNLIESSTKAVKELEFAKWSLSDLSFALENGTISQDVYAEAVKRVNSALGIKTKTLEEQQRAYEQLHNTASSFMKSLDEATEDATAAFEELNMTPLERQISRIQRQIDRDLAGAIENLKSIEGIDPQDLENQISAITRAARDAQESQAELARKSYEYQRSFAYGWRDAFNQYKESARDASQTARKLFNQVTGDLEDQIINFAKTGDFEWKKMVEGWVETLARAQIQRTFASILEATGLGDLFGTGGGSKGSGGAAVGINPSRPMFVSVVNDVMGSMAAFSGGQNNTGIAGYNNVLQDIFGQSQQQTQQRPQNAWSGIVDTATNVFNSVKGLFGGFFATGGMIPPGRFGVVGEAGAELVSGPATVTPMNKLGSTVNYYINAVDAQSFQQLLAREPQLIHALAQRGASKIPGRR